MDEKEFREWEPAFIKHLRACLYEGGGPQVGEVTWGWLPHLICKRDLIKMRDYMDRRVTPPKRVTSPIWGTPPPSKQALNFMGCLASQGGVVVVGSGGMG